MTEFVLNEILSRFDALQHGQNELQAWRAEVRKYGGGRQQPPPAQTRGKDESVGSDDPEAGDPRSGVGQPINRRQAQDTVQGAASLASLLSSPPPSGPGCKARDPVQYKGVPQTPMPRQDRVDQRLFTTEKKLEIAMHQMVRQQEVQDPKYTGSVSYHAEICMERCAATEENTHVRQASTEAGYKGRWQSGKVAIKGGGGKGFQR